MSIEVKGLTKNYGEQKAVNNVSFAVARERSLAFSVRTEPERAPP